MWSRTVDGRVLTFRLFGINNQNFIMRDEQTGTWWQQVTGEAIQGALAGRRLSPVFHDEISFGVWRRERPQGRVLRPAPGTRVESADWESEVRRLPTVTPRAAGDPLEPRALVVGVTVNGKSKAYPFALLRAQSPLMDTLGGRPIAIVVGDDGESVRVFERLLDGQRLELYARPGRPLRLIDAQGGEWDFAGRALAGAWAGRELARVRALKEYWFDWKTYQPTTTVYMLGAGDKLRPAR